jgi:exonuclease SbcD
MRILHTSDWHIGRDFDGASLADFQKQFLVWLSDQVKQREIDLVLVAGDIYDKAMPKGEAVSLLDWGLDQLRAAGASLLLISGNHDNAARLSFGAGRQRPSGVFIEAKDEESPEPFVYSANGKSVILAPIPFLDPQRAPQPELAPDGSPRSRTHQHVLEDAIRVAQEKAKALGDFPVLAVAHAYVQGSELSDSERRSVGGSDVVDASIFQSFTYTALGHLHRPQSVHGDGSIAYSGSPLAYSFSEEHEKSVRLLELNDSGTFDIKLIPIPVGRPVKVLTDSFENFLNAPEYEAYLGHWISAKLTDEGFIEEAMSRLRHRFPYITALARASVRSGAMAGPNAEGVDFEEQSHLEKTFLFVEDIAGREPTTFESELLERSLSQLESAVDA